MTLPPRPPPPAPGAALSLPEVDEEAAYGEEEGYEREGLSGPDEDLATCPCRPCSSPPPLLMKGISRAGMGGSARRWPSSKLVHAGI